MYYVGKKINFQLKKKIYFYFCLNMLNLNLFFFKKNYLDKNFNIGFIVLENIFDVCMISFKVIQKVDIGCNMLYIVIMNGMFW